MHSRIQKLGRRLARLAGTATMLLVLHLALVNAPARPRLVLDVQTSLQRIPSVIRRVGSRGSSRWALRSVLQKIPGECDRNVHRLHASDRQDLETKRVDRPPRAFWGDAIGCGSGACSSTRPERPRRSAPGQRRRADAGADAPRTLCRRDDPPAFRGGASRRGRVQSGYPNVSSSPRSRMIATSLLPYSGSVA
jgi:hypothetical protein